MKKLSISKQGILDVVKASIVALILSLIGVLLLALFVKLFSLQNNVIMPINQVIKILSILGGCLIGFKVKEKGALKGGAVGLVYTLLSILVFGLLEKTVSFKAFNWYDLVAGLVAGIISGIIAVNIGKKKAKQA